MPFESFIGNVKAVRNIRSLLATGRLPSALLFAGVDGVGKKTLALMVAKALNCERYKDDFCGVCSRCRKGEEMLAATRADLAHRREIKDSGRRVEGLVYFDLQLIEPLTRYILIEQVRQLRKIAYTRPFELPRRVFVIDEAQLIHWQAVDLLLKVLEEPPETTTLILVCPNRYEIRPTIRSRCRWVRFAPVDESTLNRVLAEESRLPKNQRALISRLAAGSLARARALDPEDFRRKRRPWLDFLDCLAGTTVSAAGTYSWKMLFESTRALTENRDDFEDTLRIGYALLRDLMQMVVGGEESDVVNVDLLPRLKAWAPKLGLAGVERLKDSFDEAYRLQTRNVNQQLGLDALAIDLRTDT